MSFDQIDSMPRMKDYLRPADLNLDGCVKLAGTVLQDMANEYVHARRALMKEPNNEAAKAHMKNMVDLYHSDYFKALSCGLANGDAVMRELDKTAFAGTLRGAIEQRELNT